ncbi:MAG: cysteine peptidase family C39 domain-containing protein [Candidatus Paceibacterota bacterium]
MCAYTLPFIVTGAPVTYTAAPPANAAWEPTIDTSVAEPDAPNVHVDATIPESEETNVPDETPEIVDKDTVRIVPFYSQFTDISDLAWKKIGCGIASLAMLIDYYEPAVSVDTLLAEGIAADAYLDDAGWTYAGLVGLAEDHGLSGESVVLHHLSMNDAFASLEESLEEGPVMASVYYTFTLGHPIPHLVIINDIEDDIVHYNDPAEPAGGGTISVEDFKPAWKKRYIEIRPSS